MKLFVIAGHGAGDPGACANGYQEAERVRALAARIKAFGGDAVEVADTSRNWYADNGISSLTLGKDWAAIELHQDSAAPSARGGHVIIYGGYSADQYDKALAEFIGGFFPGRANTIVGRTDLANPKRAARRGINYRLLECCFISNAEDIAKFNAQIDDVAKGILAAFGIASGDAPAAPSPAPSAPAALDVDGWWGPATVRALQAALGTDQDGVVSNQDSRDMSAIGGVPSTAWQVGRGGSDVIAALQSKVGVEADRYFGPNTCRALQAYLGTEQDGVLSHPSQAVRELQRRLNAGTF